MLKKRQLSAKQQRLSNFRLGERGEARAATFLISLNYHILDQNVRLGTHEIDLICRDPATGELVFVEVKARSNSAYGSPSAAVTRTKLKSLYQVARAYQRTHRLNGAFRFDVIAVVPGSVEHYQNITWNYSG